MKNFTVVSDPGIDDLIALVLLKKLSGLRLNTLVPTFGNGPLKVTLQNAKEIAALGAKSWNIKTGSELPSNGKLEHPWPDYFHGPDGVWGVHPEINTSHLKMLSDYPDNNDLISLAPMRDSLDILKSKSPNNCIVMGGVFDETGNETQYAETNIAFDPDSASEFFRICWRTDVKVVPLDVTRKVYWDIKIVESIPESDRVNIWLKKVLLKWFEKYNHEREKSFCLHDPLAVFLNFYPDYANWERTGIDVKTKGKKRGATIRSSINPAVNIAMKLDDPELITAEIFKIVFEKQ